jgi:hypothetical protein
LITAVVMLFQGGLSAITTGWVPLAILLGVTAFFKIKFFWPVYRMKPIKKLVKFMIIHYLSKWNFIKGGLDGQKKFGTLNVEG